MVDASLLRVELFSPAPGARTVALGRIECNVVGQRETPPIQAELMAAAGKAGGRLVVDLSAVTMLTSVGIGMFVTLHGKCKGEKGKLALFGLRPDIVELLRLTRLDKLFLISKDKDAAVKAVA